jgi:hypothetical protein
MSQDTSTPAQGQRINIELKEDKAQGTYANATVVTHSTSEFVFDFIRVLPGIQKAQVVERIIMAAPNAKAFLKSLQGNIERYEKNHGKLPEPSGSGPVGFTPSSNIPS